MSQLTSLPPVAQRTYVECKKCGCDRFHVVVAHTTATSAKVECEVCHAKKTLKVDSGKPKKAKTKVGVKRVQTKAISNRWDEVRSVLNETQKQPYNMKANFPLHTTIEHPKFGVGVVTAAALQSIEVVFEDGTRSLVHNRT
ncbi:MAG: hypothetical protein K1X29_10700 [Bdellovibrionales bacterium]|nr:hypothetical protein [Bdellovibrionales bacterium]